ncbi:NADP-dependent oxidoreductase [Wenyingzhuangia marina]|uniref:Enoyl reductase (ER) domain-containing protein n=1 Tax=Wenyingzhuangia marina TaxID=1195760 RepID=A0A1M5TYS0_9FLAO|nr:NADP-dependent oxidoreductase [Wenyingzhuangia marina]GGF70398.1 putative NADP-dependent oxidoreductase YfmJ [Wenyingzhuangia marina]SHH55889.1 hypothetical protein SAMN05444281_0930 [Wenyingzhuangia marina]
MNQTIILKQRPIGAPTLSNFDFVNDDSDLTPKEGEILLETTYISVDPYLRGRMSDAKSYVAPFEVGQPINSGIVAKVLVSKNTNFKEGDYVSGLLDWKTKQISNGKGLNKVNNQNNIPLSAYLGVVGMTGLTAYCGLTQIGKPKEGETLVVSGAAGAVGTIVGQIGKILGLRVIGIAGSDEKVEMLTSDFGYDEAINYKTTKDLSSAIASAAPNGVDIYFDNVGGDISEAVLYNINQFSRIIVCGAISVYNNTTPQKNATVQPFIVKNSALMQGFIVSNYASIFPEAIQKLATWLEQNKLTHTETIVEGFENTPQAFIDLLDGKNKGKMIVKTS